MSNIIRFPNNIFAPTKCVIKNYGYDLYRANFRSMNDLYTYLKSYPEINSKVFPRLASSREGFEFAGVDFEKAVEDLVKPVKAEYGDFLKLQSKLDTHSTDYVTEYVTTKSAAGSVIDIPSYVSGSPLCYISEKEVYEPKFVRLNVLLSYYCGTSKSQVENRALVTTSLINALEKEGYIVDINAFAISEEGKELMNINVNLKNSNDSLNKANLIKSLCYVEFLRRIIFRVKETIPVKDEDWGDGYGCTCDEEKIRAILRLTDDDIFIDQPREMRIRGNDLIEDFEAAVDSLKIENKIDVKESRKELETEVKRMSLRIRR